MSDDKLDQVLGLARRGLRVFPLIENGKSPAFAGWQDAATSDESTLTAWFTGQYKRSNVGVATGRGMFVLDADVKNGGQGNQSLDLLEMLGLEADFVVETASGGKHAYFTTTELVPNSVRKLDGFPDIDVRGEGGLVVAPGTIVDGRPYTILRDGQIPKAQSFVVELAQRARKLRERATSIPAANLDTPQSIDRAIHYLTTNAPIAIEGASGDDTTYRVAAHIKDYGLSEQTALDLLLAHYNDRCQPPWDPADLEAKVNSAYAHGTSQPGAKSAEAEFDAVQVDLKVNTPKPNRLFRVPFDEAASKATQEANPALIDDLLEQHSFAVVYGPSNSGKTFLALSLSYHIATHQPWAGHDTAKGTVLYVVAEGGRGINKRIAALKQHYKPKTQVPLDIVPCPVDLRSSDADVKRIVQLATEAEEANGHKVLLIVIDTLSRALAGGDENGSEDMGAFILNVDKLRAATSATVLVVHHSGKNVANGARGWSGLRAAIDTEIEVLEGGKIEVVKQRDLEMIAPFGFRLEKLHLGVGAGGKDVTSCVLHPLTQADLEFEAEANMPPLARDYFDCLRGVMSTAEWGSAFDDYLREGHLPPVGDKAKQRLRAILVDSQWIGREGKTHWQVLSQSE